MSDDRPREATVWVSVPEREIRTLTPDQLKKRIDDRFRLARETLCRIIERRAGVKVE